MKAFTPPFKENLERIAVFRPEEVLRFAVDNKKCEGAKRNFLGHMVKMFSLRYATFKKSLSCCNCGITGSIMALERHFDTEPYHFNLYAVMANGEEVLMTKDHIIPKSKGGEETIDNMRTMCIICNEMKGNNNRFVS